jgi:hypothetical protein
MERKRTKLMRRIKYATQKFVNTKDFKYSKRVVRLMKRSERMELRLKQMAEESMIHCHDDPESDADDDSETQDSAFFSQTQAGFFEEMTPLQAESHLKAKLLKNDYSTLMREHAKLQAASKAKEDELEEMKMQFDDMTATMNAKAEHEEEERRFMESKAKHEAEKSKWQQQVAAQNAKLEEEKAGIENAKIENERKQAFGSLSITNQMAEGKAKIAEERKQLAKERQLLNLKIKAAKQTPEAQAKLDDAPPKEQIVANVSRSHGSNREGQLPILETDESVSSASKSESHTCDNTDDCLETDGEMLCCVKCKRNMHKVCVCAYYYVVVCTCNRHG